MALLPDPVRPAAHTFIRFYVDGGVLGGRNPSKVGVYWSMLADTKPAVLERNRDTSRRYLTNNDAEWLAVLAALRYATENYRTRPIVIYTDSQLVVKQFNGTWRAKVARHHNMRTQARQLADELLFCAVQWQPRAVLVEKLGH